MHESQDSGISSFSNRHLRWKYVRSKLIVPETHAKKIFSCSRIRGFVEIGGRGCYQFELLEK